MEIELKNVPTLEKQYYLQHLIVPRPIALASTKDKMGRVNLSPFSFFNLFSSEPPVVIFSPARRLRNNTTKHTLENVRQTGEVVINLVDYDMVQQTSLASCEYPEFTDEFVKAGFTKVPATLVSPPLVGESPASLECRVLEIKSLGERGGAGQLVICEVLKIHVKDCLLDRNGRIDQRKFRAVARLGGNWYSRVSPSTLFEVPKPNTKLGMGIDQLPASVRSSEVLSGNDLGILANYEEIPVPDPTEQAAALAWCKHRRRQSPEKEPFFLHNVAKYLLKFHKPDWAWQVLLLEKEA